MKGRSTVYSSCLRSAREASSGCCSSLGVTEISAVGVIFKTRNGLQDGVLPLDHLYLLFQWSDQCDIYRARKPVSRAFRKVAR